MSSDARLPCDEPDQVAHRGHCLVASWLASFGAHNATWGLSIVLVLLYHGNVSWVRGGHLGVTAFFVACLALLPVTCWILVRRGAAGRKDTLPLVPFLAFGVVVAALAA